MKKLVTMGAGMMLALATAAVPIAPAIAQEEGDLMYERYYYDDADMTIQVGYERDTCNRYGVGGGRTEGRYGPYVYANPIARCVNGQLQPY
ncbi:hypothetical protein ASE67_01610 [Sphingomonas sp. Leaf23]|uniref:hypothetical protein n=1 Tax=Sphingomonas sp. Leaf23 TaxID=1735689 RepID=UPI0006F9807A|nr:hypothetical protein [Sphingomonas sp. Leaf23]KQM88480.1 hypothetical protein ASE67_01610 [Sphingomonas sp. Leaf23]